MLTRPPTDVKRRGKKRTFEPLLPVIFVQVYCRVRIPTVINLETFIYHYEPYRFGLAAINGRARDCINFRGSTDRYIMRALQPCCSFEVPRATVDRWFVRKKKKKNRGHGVYRASN